MKTRKHQSPDKVEAVITIENDAGDEFEMKVVGYVDLPDPSVGIFSGGIVDIQAVSPAWVGDDLTESEFALAEAALSDALEAWEDPAIGRADYEYDCAKDRALEDRC